MLAVFDGIYNVLTSVTVKQHVHINYLLSKVPGCIRLH